MCVWWIGQKYMMVKRDQDLVLLSSYLSKRKIIWLKIWVGNIFATSHLCWYKECSGELMEVMCCTNEPPAVRDNTYNSQGFPKCGKKIQQNTELMRVVSKYANSNSRNTAGILTQPSTLGNICSVSLVSSMWHCMTLNCTVWASTGKQPTKSHSLSNSVIRSS